MSSEVADKPANPAYEIKRTPPWVTLIVGFFLLDGLFRLAIFFHPAMGRGDLLFYVRMMIPPMSFLEWNPESGKWQWVFHLRGVFAWFAPTMEVIAATSVLRTPAKARRFIKIAGASILALGILNLLCCNIASSTRRLPLIVANSMEIPLACFLFWFLDRFHEVKRRLNLLLTVYFLAAAVSGLAGGLDQMWQSGSRALSAFLRHPQAGVIQWMMHEYYLPIFVTSLLLLPASLLLRRRQPPIAMVCWLLCLASVLSVTAAIWLSVASNSSPLFVIRRTMPFFYAANVPLFLAAAWWMWRHRSQLRDSEFEHCNCGYNLTGNESGVCPECGVALKDGTRDDAADSVLNNS